MAIDLFEREIDYLKFELSMNQCSAKLSRLANEILEKGVPHSSPFKFPYIAFGYCLYFYLVLLTNN